MTTDPISDVSRLLRSDLARVEASTAVLGSGRQRSAAGGQGLPAAGAEAAAPAPSLAAAVESVNRAVRGIQRELSFRVDQDLGEVVISVSDPETGELLRQIPAEHVLSMARMLRDSEASSATPEERAERIRGLILDERA